MNQIDDRRDLEPPFKGSPGHDEPPDTRAEVAPALLAHEPTLPEQSVEGKQQPRRWLT